MKAQEPELKPIPAKTCHRLHQLGAPRRLEAAPQTIRTLDEEQAFEYDAAMGGIQ